MTNQEIKEELIKHITDGITIKFTTYDQFNNDTEIYLSSSTDNANEFIKQKATLDNLSRFLLENGYKIKMSAIEVCQSSNKPYYQSIIFERKGDK